MGVSGVRSSCETVAKKASLARLASSARRRAASVRSSECSRSISISRRSLMSFTRIMAWSMVPSTPGSPRTATFAWSVASPAPTRRRSVRSGVPASACAKEAARGRLVVRIDQRRPGRAEQRRRRRAEHAAELFIHLATASVRADHRRADQRQVEVALQSRLALREDRRQPHADLHLPGKDRGTDRREPDDHEEIRAACNPGERIAGARRQMCGIRQQHAHARQGLVARTPRNEQGGAYEERRQDPDAHHHGCRDDDVVGVDAGTHAVHDDDERRDRPFGSAAGDAEGRCRQHRHDGGDAEAPEAPFRKPHELEDGAEADCAEEDREPQGHALDDDAATHLSLSGTCPGQRHPKPLPPNAFGCLGLVVRVTAAASQLSANRSEGVPLLPGGFPCMSAASLCSVLELAGRPRADSTE